MRLIPIFLCDSELVDIDLLDTQFALDGKTDGLCIGAGSGSFIGSGNGLRSGSLDGSSIAIGLFITLGLCIWNDSGNGLGSGIGFAEEI
jgi:hypothetical protein